MSISSVQQDRMRVALNNLLLAQQKILTAIYELRIQDYTTEADNLDLVLADLKLKTDAAIQAIVP